VSVFNASEEALYLELKRQLPRGFYIFPKIRIIDFIDVASHDHYATYRNKIWSKHVDFLICDYHFKPVLAVELNGKSHLSPQRVVRDAFVKSIYFECGLPFETVDVGTAFGEQVAKIVKKIE